MANMPILKDYEKVSYDFAMIFKKKLGSMNLEIVACATAMAAPSTSPVIAAIVNDFDYHDYYNDYYENCNHDGTSW